MATKRTSTPKPTTESPERQRLRAAAVARSRATLAAWGVPTRAATPTAPAADGGDLPRTNDWAMLADGRGVTTCCGAAVTYSDEALCCKGCWREV